MKITSGLLFLLPCLALGLTDAGAGQPRALLASPASGTAGAGPDPTPVYAVPYANYPASFGDATAERSGSLAPPPATTRRPGPVSTSTQDSTKVLNNSQNLRYYCLIEIRRSPCR